MRILITGGAGFIGCNVARHYLERGDEVVVIDDLSRKGSGKNLEWLKTLGPVEFVRQDIRDFKGLSAAVKGAGDVDLVFHMAAQVAVTTSVEDPRTDFDINALGTFNLLEAIRASGKDPVVIYASTNKVYGEMTDLDVVNDGGKYRFAGMPKGIPETRQLDFHSPYGCSKGCADQYVADYARIYGMRTVCMRQSCIYGPRQFGVEDQGWVAHFTIAAALGRPITVYGDGMQVRDVLHVQDLVELFQLAHEKIDRVKGMAFNIGGGPANQMSLLELIDLLGRKAGRKIEPVFSGWRPGDQKIYVSDISRAKEYFGWEPKIDASRGAEMLWEWVADNKELFRDL